MMDKQKLLENISELRPYRDKKMGKYRRNFRRYNYTPFANPENIRNPMEVGYFQGSESTTGEQDTTETPEFNVTKSCIDTLSSKMAQSKVRPFFNCINGSFKDILIVKQAQQYFDQFFDFQNVNKKVSNAFRDSAIFDTGVLYVDEEATVIRRVLPWQIYFRPSEQTYGKLTRIFYEQVDFPVTLLPERIVSKYKDKLENYEYITYGLYYDTFNGVKAVYIPEINEADIQIYEAGVVPFVFLHYCSPICGDSSESIVDMLNPIQLEIDTIMTRVKDASQLTPANTIFVPEGGNIKASSISNRIANIMSYRPTPNMTGSPVSVATPAFISPQYMETVQQLKEAAYEMVGISQLSAQSKKPTGLDAGIALQTMENIESDRFEIQLNQVIRAYVDLAKTCILCFDKNKDILPENENRRSIKWKDIVEESKKMSIQFSGADSLSKDPSEKLKQLQMLSQAGIIPASRIAQFIEIPDLQSGYSLSNNAINAVMTVIQECIEKNNFDVPEYIPFTMLKEEIINTQLSLKSANPDKNQKDIEKLDKLYEIVEEKEQEWQTDTDNMNAVNEQLASSNESGIASGQNVLEQQAMTTQVPQQQGETPQVNPVDLDVSANGPEAGSWNG